MISKKVCPRCGSEDVYMAAGGITGGWICKNCGYSGGIIEKEILGGEAGSAKVKRGKK